MHLYTLSILTPEKTFFKDSVYSINAPGAEGYLEVLAHHSPFMCLIQPGKLMMTDKNHNRHIYLVSSGFLEVSHNQATLIVDSIQKASD